MIDALRVDYGVVVEVPRSSKEAEEGKTEVPVELLAKNQEQLDKVIFRKKAPNFFLFMNFS